MTGSVTPNPSPHNYKYIMIEQDPILTHLDEVYKDFEASLNGLSGKPIHDLQRKSFEALKLVRFPDRKHEDWKYTPVQKLISPAYQLPATNKNYTLSPIENMDNYVIHVINGKVEFNDFLPLKNHGINVLPLHEALNNDGWKSTFAKWVFEDNTITVNRAFELLNYTFQSSGFYVDIPKNIKLDKPIEIRIIHDAGEMTFSHPLYFIRCNTGSEIQIIERLEGNVNAEIHHQSLINSLGYIHLEPNATATHVKWQDLPLTQNLVYKLFVTQMRDSHFSAYAFDHGGNLVRNNVEIELLESNTYSSLQAGYVAGDAQSMDHQTRINHLKPYCESHELYKGILEGRASGAFNGKVFVHKDAQKTNAYQQNDTLVLSQHALMNSKPQLEIFADDVRCSHGATIGQLDEKAMFYLRSRGIVSITAKHMLKEAFIGEVLEKLPIDAMRQYIIENIAIKA